MDAKRWQRQWDLFHQALDLAPTAREAWLAHACADDPALAEEVRSLLSAHAHTQAPLDRAPLLEAAHSLRPGDVVGRYRVVRELGQGGMGRVYLVERAEGDFVQRGALKLLAPSMASTALVRRFHRERQILASLNHPHIAGLLDGGNTPDGLPYLVMQYIEGEPVDQYCVRRGATLAERLGLIISLCEAVDYAHRHLVVHRDIKPGNVLVDGDGRAVLLDFGIAKLLDATGDDGATEMHGARAFTARYASPEQLRGDPMGTHTDVYSLGVLLYELISGRLPYALEGHQPERMAAHMAAHAPAPLGRLGARGERLPTELDWIVRRALAAEPARRYVSAGALADDLRALLAHRPVHARPDSLWYRAHKFARRRWAWVVVGLAFAIMVGGFGLRLARESERTRLALEQTRIERDRSQRTAAFLADLFKQADSTQQGGADISARTLLEHGRRALAGRDDLPPTARATLLNSLADVHRNLGLYQDAAELAEQSLQVADALGDAGARADALLRLGQAQQLAGEHRLARAALTEAWRVREAGNDALATAAAAEALAVTLQALGERAAAKPLFERSLALLAERVPPNDARRADAALRMGSWYWVAGQFDEAARWYGQALAARRAAVIPDLPELARALDANAALAQRQGRYADALPLYEEALDLRRRVLGNAHRLTADTLSNLGACRFDAGDAAGAASALGEAVAIFERVLPPNAPPLAKALNNLGLVRQHERAFDEARALYTRALAIHRATYGEQHALVASTLNNLGLAAEDAGDLATAAPHYEQALRTFEATVGAQDLQLGFVLTNLARVRYRQGDWPQARALFERALALRQAQLPAEHPALAETNTWFGYAQCRRESGALGAAGETRLRHALAVRERTLGESAAATQETRGLLGACLRQRGALAEGQALLDAARAPLLERRGATDLLVRELYPSAH